MLSEATIGLLDTMPNDADLIDPADVYVCGTLPRNTEENKWYEVECHKTGSVVIIQHQNKTAVLSVKSKFMNMVCGYFPGFGFLFEDMQTPPSQ